MKTSEGNLICGPECWNAEGSACTCVCGGINHGKGFAVDPLVMEAHLAALKPNRKRWVSDTQRKCDDYLARLRCFSLKVTGAGGKAAAVATQSVAGSRDAERGRAPARLGGINLGGQAEFLF